MKLEGELRERLHKALLSSFDASDLEQLVTFKMDDNYYALVPSGGNLSGQVFKLISHYERVGRLKEFVEAVQAVRPDKESLQAVCEDVLVIVCRKQVDYGASYGSEISEEGGMVESLRERLEC